MSIARALTKRYRSQDDTVPDSPRSFGSMRSNSRPINRAKISLPVELLSTTNVLAYDAPDIHTLNTSMLVSSPMTASPMTASPMTASPLSAVSSASSRKSYDDESSPGLSSSSSVSSAHESRESSPMFAEHSHLSNYFVPPSKMPPTTKSYEYAGFVEPEVPILPVRAPSHTKRTHQVLARKRSQSNISNLTHQSHTSHPSHDSNLSSPPPSASFDFGTKPDAAHPFGAELAQVNELAEEFGVTDNVRIFDEEEQFLIENGLRRFSVDEYIIEIESLLIGVFDNYPSGGWL